MIKSRGLNPLHHVLATGHRNKAKKNIWKFEILKFFTSFLYFVLEKYILLKKILFFKCSQKYLFVHCITIIVQSSDPFHTHSLWWQDRSLKSNHSKWYHIVSSLFKPPPPFTPFFPLLLSSFYVFFCTMLQLKRTK